MSQELVHEIDSERDSTIQILKSKLKIQAVALHKVLTKCNQFQAKKTLKSMIFPNS